jgi:hypothetical protein
MSMYVFSVLRNIGDIFYCCASVSAWFERYLNCFKVKENDKEGDRLTVCANKMNVTWIREKEGKEIEAWKIM